MVSYNIAAQGRNAKITSVVEIFGDVSNGDDEGEDGNCVTVNNGASGDGGTASCSCPAGPVGPPGPAGPAGNDFVRV